jgi:HK97 family phage major capsid protein
MTLNNIVRDDAAALIPEEVSDAILASVAETSAVLGNPLVNRVTMSRKQLRFPIAASLPTAYWVDGDDGVIDSAKMTWQNKFITAEKLAVVVPVPVDVLDDAEYDIWAQVSPKVANAISAKFDQAVLFGTDTPFDDTIAGGIVAAGHTVTEGDSEPDIAADFNAAFGLVEADGFAVNGIVARPSVKAKLRGLRTEDGALVYQTTGVRDASSDAPSVFGEPVIYATNGTFGSIDDNPGLAIVGDWSQVFVGVRKDITVSVLTEATVGGVNLAETDQVGLKVTFRGGFVVANPPTSENPDDETRYPFAGIVAAQSS